MGIASPHETTSYESARWRCLRALFAGTQSRNTLYSAELEEECNAAPVCMMYVTCDSHAEVLLLYRTADSGGYGLDRFDRVGEVKMGRKTAMFFKTVTDERLPSCVRASRLDPSRSFRLDNRRVHAHINLQSVPARELQRLIAEVIQRSLHRQGFSLCCCCPRCCYNFAHDLMVAVGRHPEATAGGYLSSKAGRFEPISICTLWASADDCWRSICWCTLCAPEVARTLAEYLSAHGFEAALADLAAQEKAATAAGVPRRGADATDAAPRVQARPESEITVAVMHRT